MTNEDKVRLTIWVAVGLAVITAWGLAASLLTSMGVADDAAAGLTAVPVLGLLVLAVPRVHRLLKRDSISVTLEDPTVLGALKGAKTYRLRDGHVEVPGGARHPVTRGVVASVDTAGALTHGVRSRRTLTRIAAGGVVAGPVGALAGAMLKKQTNVKVDSRELYLLIDGPDWAVLQRCNPRSATAVRRFAQAINQASRAAGNDE